MSEPLKFEIVVTAMDLDAWAIDYGIDRMAAPADFKQFVVDNAQGSVDELLHRLGYHDQSVEVRPIN